jgi:hypothetical protein
MQKRKQGSTRKKSPKKRAQPKASAASLAVKKKKTLSESLRPLLYPPEPKGALARGTQEAMVRNLEDGMRAALACLDKESDADKRLKHCEHIRDIFQAVDLARWQALEEVASYVTNEEREKDEVPLGELIIELGGVLRSVVDEEDPEKRRTLTDRIWSILADVDRQRVEARARRDRFAAARWEEHEIRDQGGEMGGED